VSGALTIGRLARAAGVHVETIRYYQRRGLLATPRRPPGGVRRYPPEALARLRFIRRAQQLGFSLREVRELLALGAGACDDTRRLAEHRLADIEARLADLGRMRSSLKKLISACRTAQHATCPIVASLGADDPR
jgi:MerR family transcriptional regulator, mercuric resistance operon regulatory protein